MAVPFQQGTAAAGKRRTLPTGRVTNAQFADFVNATGYKTEAERFGWSFVFQGHLVLAQLAAVRHRVVGSDCWCRVEVAT